MKIELVALANSKKEAFVEKRFSDGLNIIYDFYNNKGKTILFQSMMYALGNKAVWPAGFESDECIFICQAEINGRSYRFLRRKNRFLVLDVDKQSERFFDSVSELRYFLTEIGIELPVIVFNSRKHIVYPELFYQLFFLGQDDRSTSNICHSGMYSKDDFNKMVYSCYGIPVEPTKESVSKEQINTWKNEVSQLKKELAILKSKSFEKTYLSYEARRVQIDEKIKMLDQERERFSSLKKDLDSQLWSVEKNKSLEKEIDSISRKRSSAEIVCGSCGSHDILFKKDGDFVFSVRDSASESAIKKMIADRINAAQDEIDRIHGELDESTRRIRRLVSDPDVSLESLVCHKHSIEDTDSIESQIRDINAKLQRVAVDQNSDKEKALEAKTKQTEIKEKLLNDMKSFYKKMSPTGNLSFTDLFGKSTMVFSGSEGSEFHLSRLFAFGKELVPSLPLIVDSFREGELSTAKEEFVIEEFAKMKKQVILSASLKAAENDRYEKDGRINAICYEANTSHHILSDKKYGEFMELMESFKTKLTW